MPLNQIAVDVILRKSEQKVRRLNNDFVFVSSHGTKIDRHNLRRAYLITVNLRDADLSGSILDTDLTQVKYLEIFYFYKKSCRIFSAGVY